MQANIDTMAIKYTEIGRKIITMETKHLRMNNKIGTAIKLNGEAVDDGRIHVPGIQNMVLKRNNIKEIKYKATMSGNQKYTEIKEHYHKTKIRLFKCEHNFKQFFRYRAESWKLTKTITHKLELFDIRTTTKHIAQKVKIHRRIWIGYVLRMPLYPYRMLYSC